MKKIEELMEASDISDAIDAMKLLDHGNYAAFVNAKTGAFMPLICTMIDEWSSRHDVDPVDVVSIIAAHVAAVNEELGPMEV